MESTHTVNLTLSHSYSQHGVTPSLNGAVVTARGLTGLKVGTGYIAGLHVLKSGSKLAYIEVLINGVLYAGSLIWDKPQSWAIVTKIESMHSPITTLDL